MLRILLTVALIPLFAGNVLMQDQDLSPALASLVKAERAFAATCSQKGVRASFVDFLADSSMVFYPHPVNGRAFYLKQPAPATPPQVLLAWAPIYAEVSQAGDFGYTTGPYEFTDLSPKKNPPSYGAFFSIWKKQPDGTWKVIVDAGVRTLAPTAPLNASLVPHAVTGKRPPTDAAVDPEKTKEELMQIEREFALQCQSDGRLRAYQQYLCDCAHMLRTNQMPVVGKDSIWAYLHNNPGFVSYKALGSDVARSGDLGFVYGTYDWTASPEKTTTETGYYVRIWRKNPKGRWIIAFDTNQPLPKRQS